MVEKMKDRYHIIKVSKCAAKEVLDAYHYIHKNGGNFRSGYNYALIDSKTLSICGIAVFHTNSVKEVIKGCFGIDDFKMTGFYELGRLCMNPNTHEKNLTSFFLSNSIKMFRKEVEVKCILSYADSDYHLGYIYQACNFKYYGLTDAKKDFFFLLDNGEYKKHQRGKLKGCAGEWRYRPQKHRYLLVFDNTIKTNWVEQPYPKGQQKTEFNKK